jgi:MFS family permease
MVAASTLAAVTQGLAGAAVLTGTATIPLLIVLALVNGTVSAFTFPASSALLPQTVPPEIRRQANAINRLGFNGAMISGVAAGGALVALAGPGLGVGPGRGHVRLGRGLFALLRVSDVRDPAAARHRVWVDLREGWTEFASRTWMWVVVLGFMFLNAAFAGAILVLGPAVADETIGRPAWGLVLATQTVGAVLGAVIAMRLRVRRPLLVGLAGVASELLLVLGLALAPQIAVPLAAALLTRHRDRAVRDHMGDHRAGTHPR